VIAQVLPFQSFLILIKNQKGVWHYAHLFLFVLDLHGTSIESETMSHIDLLCIS
jgi:hypothetical protein